MDDLDGRLGVEAADALRSVFGRAQRLGFLGRGPAIDDHLRHGLRFADALRGVEGAGRPSPWSSPLGEDAPALDLGSGGGLPGLVLALYWPSSRWTLLDAQRRRTDALVEAVDQLELGERVTVVRARAEEAARDEQLRERFALVTSRSFGAPAVVAECAAGFLRAGGALVVSEPPTFEPGRWSEDGLAQLGLVAMASGDQHFRCFKQVELTPPSVPRRTGVPAKRPLF